MEQDIPVQNQGARAIAEHMDYEPIDLQTIGVILSLNSHEHVDRAYFRGITGDVGFAVMDVGSRESVSLYVMLDEQYSPESGGDLEQAVRELIEPLGLPPGQLRASHNMCPVTPVHKRRFVDGIAYESDKTVVHVDFFPYQQEE